MRQIVVPNGTAIISTTYQHHWMTSARGLRSPFLQEPGGIDSVNLRHILTHVASRLCASELASSPSLNSLHSQADLGGRGTDGQSFDLDSGCLDRITNCQYTTKLGTEYGYHGTNGTLPWYILCRVVPVVPTWSHTSLW